MKPLKKKKCRNCGEMFSPFMTTQTACKMECAAAIGKEKVRKEKADLSKQLDRERKEKKLSLQPLSFFHKKAQAAFNAYIRARDAGLPCISCGRLTGCKMNAGHFRTVGASKETRYDEDNCHLQCEHCNSYLSGNVGEYRPNLITKIGQEAFDKLVGFHEPVKWTREKLEDLAAEYRIKTKEINERNKSDCI